MISRILIAAAFASAMFAAPALAASTSSEAQPMPTTWDQDMRAVFVDGEGQMRADADIRERYAGLTAAQQQMIQDDCTAAMGATERHTRDESAPVPGLWIPGTACGAIKAQ